MRELVVTIATEGGGFDVFREKDSDGKWRFYQEGTSFGLDENDDEVDREWTSERFATIGEVLDWSQLGLDLLAFHARDVHPDHRDELIKYIDRLADQMTADFERRFAGLKGITGEEWLDERA